jgi:hypothetical protein
MADEDGQVTPSAETGQSYADPQDLQFGERAREKEERLDEALAKGEPVPPDEPPETQPRPGSKALPDE